jgi:pimeloyl-ACP methyl ester carboxylesterase
MTAPGFGRLRVPGGMVETAWWNQDAAGPVLVLLHEGLGSIGLWRDVPETLARWTSLPVFAYSRLGYGRSDRAPPPWPTSYMHDEAREVLPAVLRAAGIGRHVLIGHSDGGSIATIRAASVHDPTLLALVLIAAHFFVEAMNLDAIQAIAGTYRTSDLRNRLGRHHDHVDDAFDGWSGAWLNPSFAGFDLCPLLPAIRVPTLALQGADDPYGSPAQLSALEDHMRVRVETRLIAGARHAPHLEARAETLAAITGFILDLPENPLEKDHDHA